MAGKENWNPVGLLGFEPAKERFVILQTNEFDAGKYLEKHVPEVRVKEGRGCYGRRRVGERWGFERRRRGEGGTVEGFGRGRTGGEAVGNTRGKESLDV